MRPSRKSNRNGKGKAESRRLRGRRCGASAQRGHAYSTSGGLQVYQCISKEAKTSEES